MMKIFLTIFVIVFSLLACDSDESVKSLNFEDAAFSVVGRWYAESNSTDDSNFDMFGEYVFTPSGTIYIDEYRKINGYRRSELQGTYSVISNSITTGFDFNEGGQSTIPLKVTEGLAFSASFHRFSEDYTLTFQRIVGEVALMVGDTINVTTEALQNIEAYTSKPVEIKKYSMNDYAIASINDDGLLTAKLIGITYLKIETSIGNAVLKVSVSDNDNLWNDYSRFLGRDFDDVEYILGKHYVFKNNENIRYYYDSPYIDSVDVYKQYNRADSIIVSFEKNMSQDVIRGYLKRMYVPVDTLNEWYTDNSNYLLSTFSARFISSENKLIYTGFDPQWDEHLDNYGLSFDELIENNRPYVPSFQSRESNMVSYNLKNDFAGKIIYFLNKQPFIHIEVNSDIKIPMIKEYLDKKYTYTYQDGFWRYLRNIQIDGKEMFVNVSIADSNKLYYYVYENKVYENK